KEIKSLGDDIARKLGCLKDTQAATLACLRAVPVKALLDAWPISRPAYNTPTLPQEPREALRAGAFHRVPIIWGGTHDEERGWAAGYLVRQPFGEDVLAKSLSDAFSGKAADVAAVYSAQAYGSAASAWAAAATDVAWSCPTLQSDRYAAEHTPVFSYEFDDEHAPNPGGAFASPAGFELGAAHASELAYLFDLGARRATLTPAQQQLSTSMMRYWTNFARSGNPNGPGLPTWPRFNQAGRTLSLAPDAVRAFDLSDAHHCRLWAAVG
ncbi:MAG TPA: carboxylesterase family protein, partial [Phenylobacterium sp.]|nr:carboxylesterase family protein [Phenylobacterium sp.]